MWIALAVARWTKDAKFVDHAMSVMSVMKYDREDVRAAARAIALSTPCNGFTTSFLYDSKDRKAFNSM